MTGEEFFNLRRGSNVTVETSFNYFTEGQVLKVEYIDSTYQQVFLRDTSKPLGDQVKIVSTLFMLEFFIIGGKLPEKKSNNKVLELPFAIGDKVWFMQNNEAHEGTIAKCIIGIDITGICMNYNVLYTSKFNHEENDCIGSNKLFKTKEELLESL